MTGVPDKPPMSGSIGSVVWRDTNVLLELARTAATEGRISEAVAQLTEVVETAPGFAIAHAELAQLLQQSGRSNEALGIIETHIRRFPDAVWPLSIKAALLDAERRTEESFPVHEQLVERIPHIGVAWVNYGHALRALGRGKDAVSAYRKAIALEPSNGAAWWALASFRANVLEPGDVDRLRRALESCKEEFQRVPLLFALGRALEEGHEFEQSFIHYDEANRLRAKLIPPSAEAAEDLVRRNELLFTREFFAERSMDGEQGPIFIVGMPRSGSTLVEQILAGHPDIEALGELPDLRQMAQEIGGSEGSWLDRIGDLDVSELAGLGERYIASTKRYRKTNRPLFTDKLPANWQHIGLIRLILPGAKVIDVRREPMACCFANFALYFNRDTNLANGLEDLASYYLAYGRTVDRFETVLPEHVRTITYEGLVEDPKGTTRSLLAFLGCRFHPGCLEHSAQDRAIHTPSAEQARQPIQPGANQRWRQYAAWLEPLSAGLRRGKGISPRRTATNS